MADGLVDQRQCAEHQPPLLVFIHTRMLSGLAEPFGEGPSEHTRPRGKDVPAELTDAAERCNRYDIELYRYAQELFDSAPERAELDFQVELAAFHTAMVDGEIELEAPPPGFGGDHKAWRMLVRARAARLREEREFAVCRLRRLDSGSAISRNADNSEAEGQPERIKELEQELEAARFRVKKLEREVRRLETAQATKPRSRVAGAGGRRAGAARPCRDDSSGEEAGGDHG